MDHERINVQKWRLNIKLYIKEIQRNGFSPEQFFDLINVKNE